MAREPPGREVFHQHAGGPRGMAHHVEGEPQRRIERQTEAIVRVVFAVRRYRRIHRDDQRLEAVPMGALDELMRQLALLPDVELEPQPPAGGGDRLHRRHRRGGQGQRNLRLRRRLRQLQLALMPAQAGRTGGRDRHRQAGRLAEQRGGDAALRHVDQRAMAQLDALERRAVVGDRDVVLGGAIDEFEHALRQPPLCGGAQVPDVQTAIEIGHRRRSLRNRAAARWCTFIRPYPSPDRTSGCPAARRRRCRW